MFLNITCVSIFCTNFVCNISYSKLLVRHYRKCILILIKSALYSCQNFMKVEFYLNIFEKYSNVIFHEITSSGKLLRCLFMVTCVTFMDTCVTFMETCITFMDTCITFMDKCINLWIYVLHFWIHVLHLWIHVLHL